MRTEPASEPRPTSQGPIPPLSAEAKKSADTTPFEPVSQMNTESRLTKKPEHGLAESCKRFIVGLWVDVVNHAEAVAEHILMSED